MILEAIEYFRSIQLKLGVKESDLLYIYRFQSIVYDNTNCNTGATGGLGVLIENKRIEEWEAHFSNNSGPSLFLKKGCDDHIASLISNGFRQFISLYAKEQDKSDYYYPHGQGIRHICDKVFIHYILTIIGN